MKRTIAATALLAVTLLGGCAPEISDTGYSGTWIRGNERMRSRLSIVEQGEAYRVRWDLTSSDDSRDVRCDWDGSCVEHHAGEKRAEFRLTTSIDPQSGLLRVECVGEVFKPEPGALYFLDELILRRDGTVLVMRTIRQGDKDFIQGRRPRRTFNKMDNAVSDPPRAPRAG